MKFEINSKTSTINMLLCIDANDIFKAVITEIPFCDITTVSQECEVNVALNSMVEQTFENGYILMNLEYRIVGFDAEKQTVDVEVVADASEYLRLIEAQVFEDAGLDITKTINHE